MDTEFINTFIQKQQAAIGELYNKLLMADTKIQIIESKLGSKNTEYETLVVDFNRLNDELTDIKNTLKSKKIP